MAEAARRLRQSLGISTVISSSSSVLVALTSVALASVAFATVALASINPNSASSTAVAFSSTVSWRDRVSVTSGMSSLLDDAAEAAEAAD